MPAPAPQFFVARWHADDGHHTVLVCQEAKALRLVVIGYPVMLRKVSPAQARHLVRLDYPVRKAARKMRKMARNNAGAGVRRMLDKALAC